jgi:hypothetical protein
MTAHKLRTNALTFALLLLLAAGLRMVDLGVRPIWFDEAMEYWVAKAPLPQLFEAVRSGIQDPPLYSLLLHSWLPFADDAFGLRLPSVLFSLGSVLGVAFVAQCLLEGPEYRRKAREKRKVSPLAGLSESSAPVASSTVQSPDYRAAMLAGLVAGVTMALLPTEIRYAQEAGQYALMGLMVTLNLLALQRLQTGTDAVNCALWVASALLASYSFYGAALAVVPPLAVLALDTALRRAWRQFARICGCALTYLIGVLPLLLHFLPSQLSGGASTKAFQVTVEPLLVTLVELARNLGAALLFQISGHPWTVVPPTLLWLTLSLIMLLVLLAFPYLDTKQRLWPIFLIAVYAANALTDILNVLPLGFRYILISSPLLVVVLAQAAGTVLGQHSALSIQKSAGSGRGVSALRATQLIALSTLTLVLVVCCCSLPQRSAREILRPPGYLAWPETEDTQAMVTFWQRARTTGEATYVTSGALPAFTFYTRWDERFGEELPPAWYTACWRDATPALCTHDGVTLGIWLGGRATPQLLDELRRVVTTETESFWVLAAHDSPPELDILLGLAREYYDMSQPYDGHNATAYYFERRTQAEK